MVHGTDLYLWLPLILVLHIPTEAASGRHDDDSGMVDYTNVNMTWSSRA